MDKNPISALQEYLVRFRIVPDYKLVNQNSGTHLNEFTYEVICDNHRPPLLPIKQTGASKKEAKTKAAIAMLKQIFPDYCNTYSCNNNFSKPKTESPVPTISSSTINLGNDHLDSSLDLSINWIGKLQEFLGNSDNIKYNTIATGPAHNPRFTTTCSYCKSSIEATANTKKNAKTLAAKLMYDKLTFNNSESKDYINNILNGIDEMIIKNEISKGDSIAKAKKYYSQLGYKNMNKTTHNVEKIDFSHYYDYIKNDLQSRFTDELREQSSEIIKCCKNLLSSDNVLQNLNTEQPIKMYKNLLKDLCIDVTTEYQRNKDKKEEMYYYIIKLDTVRPLVDIGVGSDVIKAQITAILQSLSGLITLSK